MTGSTHAQRVGEIVGGEGQMHFDPLWGMVIPAAGTWFPEQALELAQKAVPSLLP